MPEDQDTATQAATPAETPPASRRFAALPPRIELEDMVEEVDARTAPDEPTSDPNRDIANRWGFGMIGT